MRAALITTVVLTAFACDACDAYAPPCRVTQSKLVVAAPEDAIVFERGVPPIAIHEAGGGTVHALWTTTATITAVSISGAGDVLERAEAHVPLFTRGANWNGSRFAAASVVLTSTSSPLIFSPIRAVELHLADDRGRLDGRGMEIY